MEHSAPQGRRRQASLGAHGPGRNAEPAPPDTTGGTTGPWKLVPPGAEVSRPCQDPITPGPAQMHRAEPGERSGEDHSQLPDDEAQAAGGGQMLTLGHLICTGGWGVGSESAPGREGKSMCWQKKAVLHPAQHTPTMWRGAGVPPQGRERERPHHDVGPAVPSPRPLLQLENPQSERKQSGPATRRSHRQ